MTVQTTPDTAWLDSELDSIERRLKELKGTMRILVASKLVDDGHAASLSEGMKMVRTNFDAVAELYEVRLD